MSRYDEAEVVIEGGDGIPLLVVGRDHSAPERSLLVRLDVHEQSVLMGARYALALSEALCRYAVAILAEQNGVPTPKSTTKH